MNISDKVNAVLHQYELPIQCSSTLGPDEAMLVNHKYILISNDFSDQSIEYSYAVIHEVAHFIIYSRRSYSLQKFYRMSRIMYNRGYKMRVPFVLWDEAKTWYEASKILRDNFFDMNGFYKYAFRRWITYFSWIDKRK